MNSTEFYKVCDSAGNSVLVRGCINTWVNEKGLK